MQIVFGVLGVMVLADDLAVALFDTVLGLRALSPGLVEMPAASGLNLSMQKCFVVNSSILPNLTVQRLVLDGTGLGFGIARRAT